MSSLASPLARSLTAAPVGVPWARIGSAPGASITNIVDDAAALIFGFRLWAVLAWPTPATAAASATPAVPASSPSPTDTHAVAGAR